MDGFQNRASGKDGLDDFPTPPWATRSFLAHGVPGTGNEKPIEGFTVWEPCANRGYMSNVLAERFGTVISTDIHDYGVGFPVVDFLETAVFPWDFDGIDLDWIITNPPFNKAEDFVHRWYNDMEPVENFALLLRMNWMEGVRRYNEVFSKYPPAYIYPYAERVPIVAGRLDRKGTTQMPYAWFVWERTKAKYQNTRVRWLPPSKKEFDRDSDWPEENGDAT